MSIVSNKIRAFDKVYNRLLFSVFLGGPPNFTSKSSPWTFGTTLDITLEIARCLICQRPRHSSGSGQTTTSDPPGGPNPSGTPNPQQNTGSLDGGCSTTVFPPRPIKISPESVRILYFYLDETVAPFRFTGRPWHLPGRNPGFNRARRRDLEEYKTVLEMPLTRLFTRPWINFGVPL